ERARQIRAEQLTAELGSAIRDGREIRFDRIACELLQRRLGAQRARRPVELWVYVTQKTEYRAAQCTRQQRAHPLLEAMPAIAPVAGENLVPAIPRQRDGDILARCGADPEGRNCRAVGEWLVVDPRQAVKEIERIRVDGSDMVVCAVALRDLGGVGRLVPSFCSERDRERAD